MSIPTDRYSPGPDRREVCTQGWVGEEGRRSEGNGEWVGGGGRVGRRRRGKGCRLESREWSVFAATPVMPAGLQRRLILPIT